MKGAKLGPVGPVLPMSASLTMNGQTYEIEIATIKLEPGWAYNGYRDSIECTVTLTGDVHLPNPKYDPDYIPPNPRAKAKAAAKAESELTFEIEDEV